MVRAISCTFSGSTTLSGAAGGLAVTVITCRFTKALACLMGNINEVQLCYLFGTFIKHDGVVFGFLKRFTSVASCSFPANGRTWLVLREP